MDFDLHLVTLRPTRPVGFHFNHGGVLMGLLCRVLGMHDLPVGLIPYACESGRALFDAGDSYHIGLTLAGDARSLVSRLAEGLRRVGGAKPSSNQPLPTLGGNFELVSVEPLPAPDLDAQLSTLGGRDSVTLRFVSPLRVERPQAHKAKGAAFLDARCFPADHFLVRAWNRRFLLAFGRYPTPEERAAACPPMPEGVHTRDPRLLWLDVPIEGAPGKHAAQPKGYTLGGVVGRITLGRLSEEWLRVLVAGQYLHVGENTHYGLGRWRIGECEAVAADPFRPARSALERIADPDALDAALEHVLSRSEAPGVDRVAAEDFVLARDRLLPALAGELRAGTYRPQPLLGFVMARDDGKVRPLAVATMRDRAAQRAACDVLNPAIETLLEDCSYAYRKGFSRMGAARAIQRAYDDGYRYVLDADITSFFDSVEWERLFAKLDALFGSEPLIEVVKTWVKSPVVFDGKTIERTQGLPQGIAVSPLLANLFLDEFDEELLGRDYRLVRFADDFVILCRDLEAAKRARDDATAALGRLGLTLNEEKTGIRTFDDGFTYLGYLFCRSLVMEAEKDAPSPQHSALGIRHSALSSSWLAQTPMKRVRELVARKARIGQPAAVEAVPLAAPTAMTTTGTRPLYVFTPDTRLALRGETLTVTLTDKTVDVPIRTLSHVVFSGKSRVTMSLVLKLSRFGVPTFFCRRSGELYAAFDPHAPDWPTWTAQASFAGNPQACMDFAREIVAAKLHNFAALAVRFKLENAPLIAAELRELEKECANKTTLEALLGLEGKGAALYFGAMKASLADEWGFVGRQRRPPPDPVNAMLSFGYTLLYNHVSTALTTAGLNPRVGLFHAEHGAYHALASDLQEEFRHVVDALVWATINRREAKPEDFTASPDGRWPCLMTHDLRRKFTRALEQRLLTEFTPEGGKPTTYREFMDAQARRVKDLILGRLARYRPLRFH